MSSGRHCHGTFGIFAILVLLGATACSRASAGGSEREDAEEQTPSAEATRVEVAVIGKTEATLDVTIPGEVQGYRDATLAAPLGGLVEHVFVEQGDTVKKGKALAHVDTARYQIQLEQIAAEIAQAERDAERAKKLGNAIATAERERMDTNLELLKAKRKMARLELGRSIVQAPFDGVVASLDVEVGEVVGQAAPAIRLVQLDPIKVLLSVPDRDVVALEPGTAVRIEVPAHSGIVPGKIEHVSPASDLDTRAFEAEVEAENEGHRLLPGMIANVHVSRTLNEGAVVIPQHWLVTKREKVGVFLAKQDVARWQDVVTGQVVRDQVVIVKGLDPGMRVVVTGQRSLADGDQLMVSREGRCCQQGRVIF